MKRILIICLALAGYVLLVVFSLAPHGFVAQARTCGFWHARNVSTQELFEVIPTSRYRIPPSAFNVEYTSFTSRGMKLEGWVHVAYQLPPDEFQALLAEERGLKEFEAPLDLGFLRVETGRGFYYSVEGSASYHYKVFDTTRNRFERYVFAH